MENEKSLTMAGIARELGLSRMTVSSVINNQARKRQISEKTIRRVQKHISSCGYVPHSAALELRRGKTETVGILHSGYLYSHLIEAYNRMCNDYSRSGKHLELVIVPPESVREGIKALVARRVSYLIWIHKLPLEFEFNDKEIRRYLLNVIPIIYNPYPPNRRAESRCKKHFSRL